MMMNNIGVYVNQTQPSSDPYFYDSQLLFQCNDGFSTATGLSSQTLKCGPKGNWIPNLTPCISKTYELKDNTILYLNLNMILFINIKMFMEDLLSFIVEITTCKSYSNIFAYTNLHLSY